MMKIAITGGIGSGKSSVAREFERLGAYRMDADEIARDVVEPGMPALVELVEAFGQEILLDNGALNRAKLGAQVFGNPEHVTTLNNIVHPAIFAKTGELIMAAEESGVDILVYEIPLLVESKNSYHFDHVITVESGVAIQQDRLQTLRGMTAEDAQKRIDAQATQAQREARADIVIDSSKTLQHTLDQVATVWNTIFLPELQQQKL